MLVAAAVCPHPPGLIPALSSGAASELDVLRAACQEAIDDVRAADPEVLVVVGAGQRRRSFGPGTAGTFAGYGADLTVSLPGDDGGASEQVDPAPPAAELPLALAVGAWLLERAGWRGATRGEEIPGELPAEECHRIGAGLAEAADRVGLLIMGDGSASRSEQAPHPFDARSQEFDGRVVAALRDADPAALMALDPVLAGELSAAGRVAWQVLAGAAGDAVVDADVLYDDAPYGVGYVVAVWERHG